MCTRVPLSVYKRVHVLMEARRGPGSPGATVTGSFVLSAMGSGTQILCKSSKGSWPLSHLFRILVGILTTIHIGVLWPTRVEDICTKFIFLISNIISFHCWITIWISVMFYFFMSWRQSFLSHCLFFVVHGAFERGSFITQTGFELTM